MMPLQIACLTCFLTAIFHRLALSVTAYRKHCIAIIVKFGRYTIGQKPGHIRRQLKLQEHPKQDMNVESGDCMAVHLLH